MPNHMHEHSRLWAVTVTLVIVCVLAIPLFLSAATIRVPANQPNIQAGIDAAVNGDTVLVSSGTYSGPGNRDIDFGGKAIVVRSHIGPELTLIDCGGSASEPHVGFILHQMETLQSKLVGFRIQNAWGATSYDGAITCVNASPEINNCLIFGNHANGMSITGNSHPQISYCRMSNNSENGMLIGDAVMPNSGGWISFCSFWHNTLDGIIVFNCDSLRIQNCSSAKNRYGFNLLGDLPKIPGRAAPITILEKSIAAFNLSGGILKQPGFHELTMNCCDAYGNPSFNYSGVDTFLTAQYGNFSQDPLFCSVALGDLGLLFGSPCLYSGNSCQTEIGATGGYCTVVCGDANNSWGVNISDAVFLIDYIFGGGPAPMSTWHGDADCSGQITVSDVVYLINYIFSGGPVPCESCP